MNVTYRFAPPAQQEQQLGLGPEGDARKFHTANVARRIKKYLPYRTYGNVPKAVTQGVDLKNQRIVIRGDQMRYLDGGKVMAGKKPKRKTNRDLVYTTTTNRLAGPHWARRLNELEGSVMKKELAEHIRRRHQ